MGIFDKIRSTFSGTGINSGVVGETGAAEKGERRRQRRLNAERIPCSHY